MRNYLLIAIIVLAGMAMADQTMTVDKGMMGKGCMMGGMGMGGGMMGNMMNTDPEKAKEEMGDLYYPGAAIQNSGICYGMGSENVMAMMNTTDSLDKVAAYYNGKFSGNDITSAKGPRFQSWMRPERSTGNTVTPPAKVRIMQSYSGKETMIMVKLGSCAHKGMMGGGMMGGGMMAGPGMMGGMGGGMMDGDDE